MLKDILVCSSVDNGVPEVPGLPDTAEPKAASPWNKETPLNQTFPTHCLTPEAVGRPG